MFLFKQDLFMTSPLSCPYKILNHWLVNIPIGCNVETGDLMSQTDSSTAYVIFRAHFTCYISLGQAGFVCNLSHRMPAGHFLCCKSCLFVGNDYKHGGYYFSYALLITRENNIIHYLTLWKPLCYYERTKRM